MMMPSSPKPPRGAKKSKKGPSSKLSSGPKIDWKKFLDKFLTPAGPWWSKTITTAFLGLFVFTLLWLAHQWIWGIVTGAILSFTSIMFLWQLWQKVPGWGTWLWEKVTVLSFRFAAMHLLNPAIMGLIAGSIPFLSLWLIFHWLFWGIVAGSGLFLIIASFFYIVLYYL